MRISQPKKQSKANPDFIQDDNMKDEYNLLKMKSSVNPYAKRVKKQVTLRMSEHVIEYFKAMAGETDIPYQNLINFYLMDCVTSERKLQMSWVS